MKLTYDERYTYNGEEFVGNDIVPLDTDYMFISYVVPEILQDTTDKNLIAEFTIDGEYYVIKI